MPRLRDAAVQEGVWGAAQPPPLRPAHSAFAAAAAAGAGQSKGSLIDDVGPWKDPAMRAEVDAGRWVRGSVGDREGAPAEATAHAAVSTGRALLLLMPSVFLVAADVHCCRH